MKLPLNCSVEYIDGFLSKSESKDLYKALINVYKIDQQQTKIEIEDQVYYTDSSKLMFVDKSLIASNKFPEAQWGKVLPWSRHLKRIKERVEKLTNTKFNVCVYYPSGESGVAFHTDYVAFGDTNLIPSLSLGEEREFQLKENLSADIYEIKLMEGSLIIMGENCQQRYEHSLPKNPKY